MEHMSFHWLRGGAKPALAALGIGAVIVMGAQSLAHQPNSFGTSSDTWNANTTNTMTPEPMRPSYAPTIKSNYCGEHSPHAWADGCPW